MHRVYYTECSTHRVDTLIEGGLQAKKNHLLANALDPATFFVERFSRRNRKQMPKKMASEILHRLKDKEKRQTMSIS